MCDHEYHYDQIPLLPGNTDGNYLIEAAFAIRQYTDKGYRKVAEMSAL